MAVKTAGFPRSTYRYSSLTDQLAVHMASNGPKQTVPGVDIGNRQSAGDIGQHIAPGRYARGEIVAYPPANRTQRVNAAAAGVWRRTPETADSGAPDIGPGAVTFHANYEVLLSFEIVADGTPDETSGNIVASIT
jgi:hypothetical protein